MNGAPLTLLLIFGELSLIAFGGGYSVLPEMQRRVVEVQHWMSAQEFSALFALANAAPGPNMMIGPLVGWHVAGATGALAASIGLFVPSATVVIIGMRLWGRYKDRPWRMFVQAGIGPVTIGLVAASAVLMVGVMARTPGLGLILAGATALALAPRLHPLWVLAFGGVAGLVGLPHFYV